MAYQMEPLLPRDLLHYEHQVAGHGYSQFFKPDSKDAKRKPQLLHSSADRCVYKPVQAQPKGDREIQFYRRVFADEAPTASSSSSSSACYLDSGLPVSDADASAVACLRRFIPVFAGVFRSAGDQQQRYICLADLLQDFVRPSVMDLKIGARTYEPGAPESKRATEVRKYSHQEDIGFLVTGLRTWSEAAQRYDYTEKKYWTKVTPDTVHSAVVPSLLSAVPPRLHRRRAVRQLLAQLSALQHWFERQKVFHFYSSSILLAVESCPAALDDAYCCVLQPAPSSADEDATDSSPTSASMLVDDDLATSIAISSPAAAASASDGDSASSSATGGSSPTPANRPMTLAAMVDFTHVLPGNGQRDENYLFGLRRLVQLFRDYEAEISMGQE